MSSTLSNYNQTFNNVIIRLKTTESLIEEERRAQAQPNATIYAEADEQYSLLVELQYTDKEYSEVLKTCNKKKLEAQ